MNKKFILIDHSIQQYGGHNLEYAIHVLRAAENEGYRPVLVTNRELIVEPDDRELKGIEIHPLYLFDLWGNAGKPRKKKPLLKKIRQHYRNWRVKRKIAFSYSNFGLLLSLENRYEEYLRNTPYHTGNIFLKLLLLFPLIYLLTLLRGLRRSLRQLNQLFGSTWLGGFSRFIRNLITSFRPLLRSMGSPFLFVNRHKKNILSRWRKAKRIESFGKDTIRMIDKVKLGEDDIVFIPTLSEFDMLGLLHTYQKREISQAATWHLLFRRNIFTGRDPQYAQQREHHQHLRKKFLHFKNQTPHHRVFFYTDTDKLTNQYHVLKTVPFTTLPIPINADFQVRQRNHDPSQKIKATYIGDARREKGYQYLPELVRGLYHSYIRSNKLKFLAQSNFSFSEYQHNADVFMARHQLDQMSEGIEIIKDPLSTSEYRELVLASDIGLILYDRDNYYARSSGALVEYLSAGIPVVVPSGSWMADQISDCIYEYHERLRLEHAFLETTDGNGYQWSNALDGYRGSDEIIHLGGYNDALRCSLVIPTHSESIMVSFEFISPSEGVYISIHLNELDDEGLSVAHQKATLGRSENHNRVSAMFRLRHADTQTASLSFFNAYGDNQIRIKQIQFHYFNNRRPLPVSSVGMIVDDTTEAVAAIREMVDHYPHYRNTAKEFSVEWNRRHSAEALVTQLIARGTKS